MIAVAPRHTSRTGAARARLTRWRAAMAGLGAALWLVCASDAAAQAPGTGDRRTELGAFSGLQGRDPDAAQTPEEQAAVRAFDQSRRSANPGGAHIPTDLVDEPPTQDTDAGDGLFRRLATPDDTPPSVASPLPAHREPTRAPMQDLRRALERQYSVVAVTRDTPVPSAQPVPQPAADTRPERQDPVVVEAGAQVIAALIAGTDSRFQMPVLARIHSGPLAGGVLSGAYTVHGSVLGLVFERLTLRGQETAIRAWAVDPTCACAALPGEIDHHWVERVILPAAAAFASGWLRSADTPDRTVTIDGTTVISTETGRERRPVRQGAAQAIDTVADAWTQTSPSLPTISLAAGTEMLVVFTAPVRGRWMPGRHGTGGGARW